MNSDELMISEAIHIITSASHPRRNDIIAVLQKVRYVESDSVRVPRAALLRLGRALNRCRGLGEITDICCVADEIIAYAEPEKPKDEILEALIEARMRLRGYGEPHPLDDIIKLRERELKERDE